jgi:hypothetical protein
MTWTKDNNPHTKGTRKPRGPAVVLRVTRPMIAEATGLSTRGVKYAEQRGALDCSDFLSVVEFVAERRGRDE